MSIELLDIHKHFGAVRANNGIDLTLRPGTIHGILGENGAGKSTLMKILAGFIAKTSGRIFMDGREVDFATPAQASALGIGMLYQDPLDFPPLTVLENFMAGQASAGTQDRRTHRARLEGLCADLGFDLDPDVPAGRLTVGERQQLELVRLLASGTRVLILDEPTTGISALQKDLLFSGLKRLAREGRSVILVSHKLEDIEALCDEITVLREGMVSGTMDPPFVTGELLAMMFGVEPARAIRSGHEPGAQTLHLDAVTATGGRTGLKECTVNVSRGEVVGLAGLEGSGQDVFLRISAGLVRPARGRVHICRKDMTGRDYHAFRALGVAFQPASRLEEGLIRGLTVTEHCALEAGGGTFGVQWDAAELKAHDRIRAFQVTGTPGSTVESLSGGNQQRLLLSFLPDEPELLLLENPTRGLDMESVHWVWQYLDAHASRGTAIVFSSSELDEILMVADRVLVFFDGRIIADERPEDTDALELGRAIAGKV
ncbi:MAG TPA: ATP-binding cassette domain-containing protein [Deltaproteobacteria bacterium]|nr:ATP-binding cassette domain-containing protein [Deltaproteobacteria bacterium]HNQ85799.1 ATP-binding cassette domain-containing protein [Deltaproteobacteria bacterium]HNS89887.1 ATP-binding cassette domain-containing protein [Deltaproteobacteria bacterium]HOA44580.1 ATP-binding cassette domain-containing protein [Deltaproteobacteria bacterium]HOC74537.1 ATP-binding cassette domain-containing protein [Deltaproteobacteria bacterium]